MKNRLKKFAENIPLLVLLIITALGLVANLASSGLTIYNTVIYPGGSIEPKDRLSVIMSIALVGLLLAILRHKWLSFYGVIQIAAAVVAAWALTTTPATEDPLTNVVALVAVTFVMARGIYDNQERDFKAREAEKKAWEEQKLRWEIEKTESAERRKVVSEEMTEIRARIEKQERRMNDLLLKMVSDRIQNSSN